MILQVLRDILRTSAAIKHRVDKSADLPGVYADNAPARETGEYILLTDVSGEHNYGLSGEVGTQQSTIQVDCYSSKACDAKSLFDLVRNRISGLGNHVTVCECIIVGGIGSDPQPPINKSDRWIHRYSKDFLVTHLESVPTLT